MKAVQPAAILSMGSSIATCRGSTKPSNDCASSSAIAHVAHLGHARLERHVVDGDGVDRAS
jgi:hypothetical protein